MMFHPPMPVVTQMIEPQTVLGGIHNLEQPGLELNQLSRIHLALEDGVLDALAVVQTGLGHLAQATSTGRVHGGNIVGDKEIHGLVGDGQRVRKAG